MDRSERKPSRQQLRTRRDLLLAAEALLKEGTEVSMEEIADRALVSRATIYRYFSSLEALMAEVKPNFEGLEGETLFEGTDTQDPEERIDMVEQFFHRLCYDNESLIRVQVAASIRSSQPGSGTPVRQNRRMPMIEQALAPIRDRLSDEVYRSLCTSLAFVIGSESMIVCQDVIHVEPEKARRHKSWAVRALVRQALDNPGK